MRLWRPHTKVTFTKVSGRKGKNWRLECRGDFNFPLVDVTHSSGLTGRVSHFINVVQSPGPIKKVQLIKHILASGCHEQTADRWYHQQEWVTAELELELSQICNIQSISPSSQTDVFGTFFVLRVKLYDVSTNSSYHAPPIGVRPNDFLSSGQLLFPLR